MAWKMDAFRPRPTYSVREILQSCHQQQSTNNSFISQLQFHSSGCPPEALNAYPAVFPWGLGGLHGIRGGKAELGRDKDMVLCKGPCPENIVAGGLDLDRLLPFAMFFLLLLVLTLVFSVCVWFFF